MRSVNRGHCCPILVSDCLSTAAGLWDEGQGKNKAFFLKQNALKIVSVLPGRMRYCAFLYEPWKQDKNKL